MNQEVQFMAAVYRLNRTASAGDAGSAVTRVGMLAGFQSYLDRLIKMIPAEVIGLYLVGKGVIPVNQTIPLLIWVLVCLIAVITVRIYGTYDPNAVHRIDWLHVVISAVAFVIWVYTIGGLGGPFADFSQNYPYVSSLLVLVWTFFVPLFYHGAD
jgi:hypothetical protein